MTLTTLDWGIVLFFFATTMAIGIWASRHAAKNTMSFFLSGRNMPWYLLGISMVATTFSVDTPNLVADIVRQGGISGNWVWWAFLLTGMLTVFVYAKLWRRSEVLTDIAFYELRYSGKAAAFLRGFRAIYLGVVFNVAIMAAVNLAAIKIGGVMLGLSPWQVILIAGGVTVLFSSLGGFLGVVLTDFILFFAAMLGSVLAAYYAVQHPEVGSLTKLFEHPEVAGKLSILPDFNEWEAAVVVFILPLTVQWWSVWYSGAEPGGGGYIAQRMLATKDEKNAMGATLLFNVAHYALRPWPWIIVALCSLVVFPDLEALQSAFPHMDSKMIGHDLAYSAMLTFLPSGVLGLVFASMVAAYMSTISTCLNLGSSYMVHDFYSRFIRPDANEKRLVAVARIVTIILMVFSSLLALVLQSALSAFNILLQIGAGTGLLFILRWFWYRINPYSELAAMLVSFCVALAFVGLEYYQGIRLEGLLESGMDRQSASAQLWVFKPYEQLLIGVTITTVAWLLVTWLTPITQMETLEKFYRKVRPGRIGWEKVIRHCEKMGRPIPEKDQKPEWPIGLLGMVCGAVAVYSGLFATGYYIFAFYELAIFFTVIFVIFSVILFKIWRRMNYL
ncbi:sodium:solute symporter family protein [Pleomorphovibrio marinus]|uniref:sodium:solute symporter family protein n=1 Tax=Pleomorphovibrio marinus TaxID=2164132 RepID=UPI000E0A9812|nr:sodium:solute symporter family protein [Pleomorphovibrio marinus]